METNHISLFRDFYKHPEIDAIVISLAFPVEGYLKLQEAIWVKEG